MKTYLKFLLFLFGVNLALFSCTAEDIDTDGTNATEIKKPDANPPTDDPN